MIDKEIAEMRSVSDENSGSESHVSQNIDVDLRGLFSQETQGVELSQEIFAPRALMCGYIRLPVGAQVASGTGSLESS